MITFKVKPTKTNLEILTNFFEMDKKGNFTWSDKKQEELFKKMVKKNKLKN